MLQPQPRMPGQWVKMALLLLAQIQAQHGQVKQVTPLLPCGPWFFVNTSTGWAAGDNGTIIKTIDGGASWSVLTTNTTTHFYSLIFPSTTIGWATGEGGRMTKTTDGGTNWTVVNSGTTTTLYGIYAVSTTYAWAVGDDGVVRRTTNGTSWSAQTSNSSGYDLYDVHFVSGLVGWSVGEAGVMVKTTNGGSTWIEQSDSRNYGTPLFRVQALTASLAFAPGVELVIRTTNGSNWSTTDAPYTGKAMRGIAMLSQTSGYIVDDDGSIYVFSGGVWVKKYGGASRLLSAISAINSSTAVAVGANGTIVTSSNGGQTWGIYNVNTTTYYTDVQCISTTCWASGEGGVLVKTVDGGGVWEQQNTNTSSYIFGVHFINQETGWMLTSGGGAGGYNERIMRTTDGGATWITLATTTSSGPTDLFFVNTTTGWVVGSGGTIAKTIDGGQSWFPQTSVTGNTLTDIYFINETTGWAAGTDSTLIRTTDGGTTWVSQSISNLTLGSIAFVNTSTGWGAGTETVLGELSFATTINGGETWSAVSTGVVNQGTQYVDYILNDGIAVSAHDRGVWVLERNGGEMSRLEVPLVTFTANTTSVSENGGTATITIALSEISALTVTTSFAFAGTAVQNTDFTVETTNEVIAGATSTSIVLTAINNSVDAADKSVSIIFYTIANGVATTTQQVTIALSDDDTSSSSGSGSPPLTSTPTPPPTPDPTPLPTSTPHVTSTPATTTPITVPTSTDPGKTSPEKDVPDIFDIIKNALNTSTPKTASTTQPITKPNITWLIQELVDKVKPGQRNARVKELQTYLKEAGYFSKSFVPTTFYGSLTSAAISKFKADQAKKKVLGQKIDTITEGLLLQVKVGERSQNVRKLQTRLFELGFVEKKHVTGFYGPITKEAVKKYQGK